MPVVRNPQFNFREGFCWNNVLNPNARLLKTKLKQPSINDVGSMSLMSLVEDIPNSYFVILLNSNLIFDYYREFINCTVNVQINDIRKLPIIIPTNEQIMQCKSLFDEIITLKKVDVSSNSVINRIDKIEHQLDEFINSLYLV